MTLPSSLANGTAPLRLFGEWMRAHPQFGGLPAVEKFYVALRSVQQDVDREILPVLPVAHAVVGLEAASGSRRSELDSSAGRWDWQMLFDTVIAFNPESFDSSAAFFAHVQETFDAFQAFDDVRLQAVKDADTSRGTREEHLVGAEAVATLGDESLAVRIKTSEFLAGRALRAVMTARLGTYLAAHLDPPELQPSTDRAVEIGEKFIAVVTQKAPPRLSQRPEELRAADAPAEIDTVEPPFRATSLVHALDYASRAIGKPFSKDALSNAVAGRMMSSLPEPPLTYEGPSTLTFYVRPTGSFSKRHELTEAAAAAGYAVREPERAPAPGLIAVSFPEPTVPFGSIVLEPNSPEFRAMRRAVDHFKLPVSEDTSERLRGAHGRKGYDDLVDRYTILDRDAERHIRRAIDEEVGIGNFDRLAEALHTNGYTLVATERFAYDHRIKDWSPRLERPPVEFDRAGVIAHDYLQNSDAETVGLML